MLQASLLDCVSFDLHLFQQDGLDASEVNFGRSQILQAIILTSMVVSLDEALDNSFQIAGQAIVFQQYPVLQHIEGMRESLAGWDATRSAEAVEYMTSALEDKPEAIELCLDSSED